MRFNSLSFLFVFLPVTFFGFYALQKYAQTRLRWGWLVLASLVFYASAEPAYLLILLFSIGLNYAAGSCLSRHAEVPSTRHNALLLAAVAFNILLLAYYKYVPVLFHLKPVLAGFLSGPESSLFPLGISFYTFTQIAFLVDAHQGLAPVYAFRDYLLMVSCFPYVTSGPIVNYREMISQFAEATPPAPVVRQENISVGLTLFCMGLFKKVIFADLLGTYSDPVFRIAATHGRSLTFFEAWFGALAYTLQLYFDFSGYSDMAIGSARLFGLKLPLNFNSPFKAVNVIDFWQRWHMSLTRFWTSYIYNPIVLAISRYRIAHGLPLMGRGKSAWKAFPSQVAFPLLSTMVIVGLWHGAGLTFIVFGLLHGVLLTVNHAWRLLSKQRVIPPWPSRLLTFLAVNISLVFFRADGCRVAWELLRSMSGFNGISFPKTLGRLCAVWVPILSRHGIYFDRMSVSPLGETLFSLGGLLVVIWFFPNTQQLLGHHHPALGFRESMAEQEPFLKLVWKLSPAWGSALGMAAAWAILNLSQVSTFLYYKF
jgi:alginate O-acetyltransferase complex protein AlgI